MVAFRYQEQKGLWGIPKYLENNTLIINLYIKGKIKRELGSILN